MEPAPAEDLLRHVGRVDAGTREGLLAAIVEDSRHEVVAGLDAAVFPQCLFYCLRQPGSVWISGEKRRMALTHQRGLSTRILRLCVPTVIQNAIGKRAFVPLPLDVVPRPLCPNHGWLV
jgi:hypothetical protein